MRLIDSGMRSKILPPSWKLVLTSTGKGARLQEAKGFLTFDLIKMVSGTILVKVKELLAIMRFPIMKKHRLGPQNGPGSSGTKKTAKNSNLPKTYFESVGKCGWPLRSS
jgi:hypothetical protein